MRRCKFQKIGRYVGYSLAGILVILLLAASACAIWLWGWTWKGTPAFHESWTPEERTAITEFDRYLRQQYAEDMFGSMVNAQATLSVFDQSVPPPSLMDKLLAAYAARCVAAPVSGMLHEAAESGSAAQLGTASFHGIYGLTPAMLAAQTAHLKALEALVQHGANPNAIAYCQMDEGTEPREIETPLSPLLSGRFVNNRSLPWDTRRQTAEFLLAHGAKLHSSRRINLLSCEVALMTHTPEGIAPWEWALDHGLPMTADGLNFIVGYAEGRPLLERVLRAKQVDVNDASASRTVLQSLLYPLLHFYDEEMWNDEDSVKVMEEYLDMLLAAGANPNLIPEAAMPQRPGESDDEYEERINDSHAEKDTPLDIATRAGKRATLPAHRELCLRIIDKLKHAGAKTSAE